MPRASSGSVFLILIGLSLAAVGALFTVLMGQSYLRAREMHAWPQTDARILASEIEEWRHDPHSPLQYRLKLLYAYEWQGEPRTSERLGARGNPWTNKRNAIEKQHESYPAGKTLTCWVDPTDPDFAILKPDSKAPGYSIWFPILFVVGGLVIVGRTVFRISFPRSP